MLDHSCGCHWSTWVAGIARAKFFALSAVDQVFGLAGISGKNFYLKERKERRETHWISARSDRPSVTTNKVRAPNLKRVLFSAATESKAVLKFFHVPAFFE